MLICKTNLQGKKLDLYLNYNLRKSRFPLNLTDRQTYIHTDGRTDISFYRVASLLTHSFYYFESPQQQSILCLWVSYKITFSISFILNIHGILCIAQLHRVTFQSNKKYMKILRNHLNITICFRYILLQSQPFLM